MKNTKANDFFNDTKSFRLILAPMVGLSHIAMRSLLQTYMPAEGEGVSTLWPTEMLSSRRLPHEKVGQTPETLRLPIEKFLVPQILGNQENEIKESLLKLTAWGADGVDINMGCPVAKALKHNYGVALMGDPTYAQQVVQMTVRHTTLPISVKLRAVDTGTTDDLLRFVEPLVESGLSWLTLHPRRGEQKRRGFADWSQIQFLKKRVSVPVIGNGDIQNLEDVQQMFSETDCNAVMVGRALTARPWLLWQWGARLGYAPPAGREGQTPPNSPHEEAQAYGQSLLFIFREMQKYFNPDLALRKFRFYVKTGSVWLDHGHALWSLVTRHHEPHALEDHLQEFFRHELQMLSRTDCRQ